MKGITVFFDLDGTLADTSDDIYNALNRTLRKFEISEIPLQTVMEYIGDGVLPLIRKTLKFLGKEDREKEILNMFIDEYERCIADKTSLYDGACNLIFFLKIELEANVILLTNKSHNLTLKLIEKMGIGGLFDGVVCGDTFDVKKPSPELLDRIRQRFHTADKFFVIGDGLNDFLFAKNTGISFIFAKWGFMTEKVENELEKDRGTCIFIAEKPEDIIKEAHRIFHKIR